MRLRNAVRVAMALAGMAASPTLLALCSGFTDVDGASAFCPNVDWLRNRAVTLGCTSTTLYCPADPVSRLAMAAFMNRLGNALTPTLAYQEAGGASLDLTASPTVCATAEVAAADYPRSANVAAVLTTLAGSTTFTSMLIVYSTNGGATWIPATLLAHPLVAQPPAGGWINGAAFKGDIPLNDGQPYRFGLRLDGTTQLGPWSCQVNSVVASRTGLGMPY